MTHSESTYPIRITCEGGIPGGGWSYTLEFRPLRSGVSVWASDLDTGRLTKVGHLDGPPSWRRAVAWLRDQEFTFSPDLSDYISLEGLEPWQDPLVRLACVNAEDRDERSLDFLLGRPDAWLRQCGERGELICDTGEVHLIRDLLENLDLLELNDVTFEQAVAELGLIASDSVMAIGDAAKERIEVEDSARADTLAPFASTFERLTNAYRCMLGPPKGYISGLTRERRVAALRHRLEDELISDQGLPREGSISLGEHGVVDLDMLELWAAYMETVFEARPGSKRIEIRVGKRQPELDLIGDARGSKGWCFITAWNPASEALSQERNRARNTRLRMELERSGVAVFDGLGRGPDPSWPPEESFLVLGISRTAASDLGAKWGQNAVVWGGPQRPAELLDCRNRPAIVATKN